MNLSERSLHMARKVHRDGLPELVALVESGDIALSVAAFVAELSEDQQAMMVARGPKAMRERAATAGKERKGLQICRHCGAANP